MKISEAITLLATMDPKGEVFLDFDGHKTLKPLEWHNKEVRIMAPAYYESLHEPLSQGRRKYENGQAKASA